MENNPLESLLEIQKILLEKLKKELNSKHCNLSTLKVAQQVLKDNSIILPPPRAGDPTEILEIIDTSIGELEHIENKKESKEEEENINTEFKAIEL